MQSFTALFTRSLIAYYSNKIKGFLEVAEYFLDINLGMGCSTNLNIGDKRHAAPPSYLSFVILMDNLPNFVHVASDPLLILSILM